MHAPRAFMPIADCLRVIRQSLRDVVTLFHFLTGHAQGPDCEFLLDRAPLHAQDPSLNC